MESKTTEKSPHTKSILQHPLPLAALVAGPIAMGASPIFVRLAEVGPYTSAFWRVALALPLFFAWWYLEETRAGSLKITLSRADWRTSFWPGIFFAGDLFFWHMSILNTSVANAAFFATLAPIAVIFGAAMFLSEPLTKPVLVGLGTTLIGAAFLLGNSFSHTPEHIWGDIYGLITAIFFAAYLLSIKSARAHMPPGKLMFLSTLVTSAILGLIAISTESVLLPQTWQGMASLASLALISQAGGQGLLAYALGHLPAMFSSLVIFIEPIAAALLGWAVLNEAITAGQAIGAAIIIIGIFIARPPNSHNIKLSKL